MTSNNALVPDPDKEDILASKPFDWPFLHCEYPPIFFSELPDRSEVGLRMCGWGDNQTKYYLMGTPLIWWASATSLVVCFAVLGVYLFRQQRKYADMDSST